MAGLTKTNKIGLWTLVSIGLGSIIGSGIFATPAIMAGIAGPSLILSIFLSGIISIFIALPYAELGAAYPLEGGPYAFPRLAMGNLSGFLMGWGFFLYLFVGTAVVFEIFVLYLNFYIPGLGIQDTLTLKGTLVATALLWILTIINILGIKWGGLYSIVTTIGKLIPLAIFAIMGFVHFHPDNFTPFMPYGFSGLSVAVTIFFFSYTGFEAIVVPTNEIENPSKNIPRAMFLTMFFSIAVYMLIAIAFLGIIDWQNSHLAVKDWNAISKLSSPLSSVSKGLGFFWLAAVITFGAIIGAGGCGGNKVLTQGRLPHAMAKDGLFWSYMSKLHPRFGTPSNSLILSSLLTTIFLFLFRKPAAVALMASITIVVPYGAAILSIPILRKIDPKTIRPFKIPLMLPFSLVGFILTTFLFYWGSWPWTLVGSLMLLTGYPVYFLVKDKKPEWKRTLWIPTYLLGIALISFLGNLTASNFLPIDSLNLIKFPYDLIIMGVFALFIFFWVWRNNSKEHLPK
jgi:basic amino acid/polyamine antiporter, APA family